MANVKDVKTALAKQAEKGISPFQSLEKSLQDQVGKLKGVLPQHMNVERLLRISMSMIKMSPKLAACDRTSLMAGIFSMAQIGLEPINGEAYLIPYAGKAQFQVGYKGLVTLFYRHPMAKALNWGIVCENDTFVWDRGQGILSHKENLKGDRGAAYGYWIKAELTTGGTVIEYMSKEEVLKHGKQHSKTFGSGPWQTDFDSMALKTVFIRGSKLMPKSIELLKALAMDNTIKTKVEADMTDVADETDWGDGKTIDAPATNVEPVVAAEQDKGQPEATKPEDQKDDLDMSPPKEDTMTRDDGVVLNKKTGKPI